ncbi:unnamed protein product [Prorocentrum cordatum]|uniref:Ubiquitin-like protein ATG12 n=1 Tax=Prorocentrum cordatum TaxID=2364126 RepID=A0ABN9VU87_9DINO|nr:unnamed protein product [Polarella glacialis]
MAGVVREPHGAVAEELARLRGGKVEVRVKNIGSAPILKQTRFTVDGSKRFEELAGFLRRQLKLETLHVYCCDAFEPAHDEHIADLLSCFGAGSGTPGSQRWLNISYAIEPAFS